MLKASEFEIFSKEELAGIDKTTAAIDALLGKYHGAAALVVTSCPLHIAAEVAHRYRNMGWNVKTSVEAKDTYIVRVTHPNYGAELTELVTFEAHTLDFVKPDIAPTLY